MIRTVFLLPPSIVPDDRAPIPNRHANPVPENALPTRLLPKSELWLTVRQADRIDAAKTPYPHKFHQQLSESDASRQLRNHLRRVSWYAFEHHSHAFIHGKALQYEQMGTLQYREKMFFAVDRATWIRRIIDNDGFGFVVNQRFQVGKVYFPRFFRLYTIV